jgi:cytochrome c556
MEDKELIWVSKEFAEKYKIIGDEQEQMKIFQEYLDQVSQQSKDDYKANLEAMEEDVAIYTGLMLKVKHTFSKAKDEALDASYAMWQGYAKEKPKIEKNIDEILKLLNPLDEKLDSINKKLGKINTFRIDQMSESISKFSQMSESGQAMFEFLVKHFNEEGGKG